MRRATMPGTTQPHELPSLGAPGGGILANVGSSKPQDLNLASMVRNTGDGLSVMQSPTAEAPLVGELLEGRYRVMGVIAKGGMGVVYEGLHVGLNRRVAIKTLHQRYVHDEVALKRFRNEAAVAGRFGHPNIVEVYDLGTLHDASPYLVMERLEGETLTERMKREHVLPIRDSLMIACSVLSALHTTHGQGILHRDLKPDNLFLVGAQPSVAVKVLDFGISKFVTSATTAAQLTRSGFVMGTPSYMAPEQAQGLSPLDVRVDLYSMGMILYEMIAGRLPYKAASPMELLKELRRVTPLSPRMLRPEVHPDLDAIVMQALHRDRDQRFPDAQTMYNAIAGVYEVAVKADDDARARREAFHAQAQAAAQGGGMMRADDEDTQREGGQQVEVFLRDAMEQYLRSQVTDPK